MIWQSWWVFWTSKQWTPPQHTVSSPFLQTSRTYIVKIGTYHNVQHKFWRKFAAFCIVPNLMKLRSAIHTDFSNSPRLSCLRSEVCLRFSKLGMYDTIWWCLDKCRHDTNPVVVMHYEFWCKYEHTLMDSFEAAVSWQVFLLKIVHIKWSI